MINILLRRIKFFKFQISYTILVPMKLLILVAFNYKRFFKNNISLLFLTLFFSFIVSFIYHLAFINILFNYYLFKNLFSILNRFFFKFFYLHFLGL